MDKPVCGEGSITANKIGILCNRFGQQMSLVISSTRSVFFSSHSSEIPPELWHRARWNDAPPQRPCNASPTEKLEPLRPGKVSTISVSPFVKRILVIFCHRESQYDMINIYIYTYIIIIINDDDDDYYYY